MRAQAAKRAAEEIRSATRSVENGQYNTAHMRRAAEAIVDMRTTFLSRDGQPDMAGASYAYRQAVRDVLSDAGVPESERSKVLTAIRYHIGNILRERYSAEQLDAWGMSGLSPLERQRLDRKARARAWHAPLTPDDMLTEEADVLAALRSASALLANIDLSGLSKAGRQVAKTTLTSITESATRLSASARKRTARVSTPEVAK